MADEAGRNFEDVQTRLAQIVDEVSAEDISLDDALKLYEEAVKLGLSACDLSEQDIDAYRGSEPASATDTGVESAAAVDIGTDPVGGDLGRPSATSADVSSVEEGGASTAPTDSTDTAFLAVPLAPNEA
ncbi:exodeoxyribonuclease VII small subunit [Adlercreutzia sp. R7]|uniref:Exodeoxyribonuclease VII small subunit n=1 Tax=Adlercreutzia wanghongyangiae TaxID=3111451 RepID=A0ABU6IH80_9ACTN|nr:exodeoxyribonuclease VII small subunit [Adlercreutzia sp. R7]